MQKEGKGTTTAIIVAGGQGIRLGHGLPKPLVEIANRPIVSYSLKTFENYPDISDIVLVCGSEWLERGKELANQWCPDKLYAVVPGGQQRCDSVRNGLKSLPDSCDKVAIHDAGRPFITPEVIGRTLNQLNEFHGAVPGVPLADTLRIQANGVSGGTRDRGEYVLTQTPQCFHRNILEEAFHLAEKEGFTGTDDASYVERLPDARIAVVDGDPNNFKITTQEDLERARVMMVEGKIPDFRCGEGFDAHRFAIGRKLILGGLEVPFELGLHGHSDADVLCHAIGDALLGAVSLGDLGKHFPDSDPQYEGISSIELLSRIREMVAGEGYAISNIDATIVVEMPKIAPHRDEIRKNIAETLQIELGRVSVKATTTEGMGPFGRGEGIACRAVALVVKG